MIAVEVHAIQWAKVFSMSVDMNCPVKELSQVIESILAPKNLAVTMNEFNGIIACTDFAGVLPPDRSLCECGIKNGCKLIYFNARRYI